MNYDSCITVLSANISPAIVVEFLDQTHVVAPVGGFVEQFDGSYDVGLGGVAVCKGLDRSESDGNIVAGLPINGAISTAIVETVLRAGCCMIIS